MLWNCFGVIVNDIYIQICVSLRFMGATLSLNVATSAPKRQHLFISKALFNIDVDETPILTFLYHLNTRIDLKSPRLPHGSLVFWLIAVIGLPSPV
jgi:hypothetical protein